MRKQGICLGLLGLLLTAGSSDAGNDRFAVPPKPSLIEARIVLKKDTYTLDPAQRGEKFRKTLKSAPAGDPWRNLQPIQIQGVPVPIVPGQPQIQIQAVPVKPGWAVPVPKDKKAKQDKKQGKKQDKEKDPKEANKPPPAVIIQAFQIQGNAQGIQIQAVPARGNAQAPKVVPEQPAPKGKKDKKGKEGNDAKKQKPQPPQVQAFQIQGAAGGVQIQGRIQIQMQGGIPGGAPQFRFMIKGAGRPAPSAVDMVIELRNVSGEELTVSLGGTTNAQLDLNLQGPGAVTVKDPPPTIPFRPGAKAKLAAGATHLIVLRRLLHGQSGSARSYWTEPGDYTLSATCKLNLHSAAGLPDKLITVETSPVKIKVIEKK